MGIATDLSIISYFSLTSYTWDSENKDENITLKYSSRIKIER